MRGGKEREKKAMNGIALDPNPFLEGMTDRREKRKVSKKKFTIEEFAGQYFLPQAGRSVINI
jgi:hypothetical protein